MLVMKLLLIMSLFVLCDSETITEGCKVSVDKSHYFDFNDAMK